ncbi:hypothetical protein [Brevibacillus migulae]|uniref:hypothetical protein n=1 Tax=Brevibacillus migulae TaxID=1644114 RepID=UPI00106DFE20|nr:hypothetical protein [Brevibacillus migulae]
MFYHGINREYVYHSYPILSPRRRVAEKKEDQLTDRMHLIEQFGLEPVHLLEASEEYTKEQCIKACLRFGDSVFAFTSLPDPLWQLSRHEVGVPVLDLRNCQQIYLLQEDPELRQLFPHKRIQVL